MRENKELLFMGAGDLSIRECARLEERLKHALSNSSGLQQSGLYDQYADHSDEGQKLRAKEDKKILRDLEQQLEDFVKDVAAALLGRSIKIGKKLPYPARLTKKQKSALAQYSSNPLHDDYMGHDMAINLGLAHCICKSQKERHISCPYHGR
jgi:hypothetical protein